MQLRLLVFATLLGLSTANVDFFTYYRSRDNGVQTTIKPKKSLSVSLNFKDPETTLRQRENPDDSNVLERRLICEFPEYRAMVCYGDKERTCQHGYSKDPVCLWKIERCLCTEGFVRAPDYYEMFNVRGMCYPESSCKYTS